MQIEMRQVESSNVAAVGYSTNQKLLVIEFKKLDKVTGLPYRYHYFGVPKSVHLNLMKADSIGKYLHKYVFNKYEALRVS